jgi:hypothetical protein
MESLVLTTLLFNTTGITVFALAMALSYCSPSRRRPRQWVLASIAAAASAPVAPQPVIAASEEAELAHAA